MTGPVDSPERIGIVVVNYGDPALLEQNLAALTRAVPGLRTVVVDNYSTPAAREAVTRLADAERWDLLLPDDNLGFGAGMNLGVARAIGHGVEQVLLLNPDATLTPEALDVLSQRCSAQPMTMFAPRIERPDGSLWFDGVDLYLHDGTIRSRRRREDHPGAAVAPWLSGACLMLSVELWARTGGFHDAYFLYWEDVDLSHRVVAVGGSLAVVEEATAVHDEGGTHDRSEAASARAKSTTYYYFNIRNRLLYAAEHLSPAEVRAWRRSTIPVAWSVLLQGGRRQFLSTRSPLRAGVRGVVDGLRLSKAAARGR